MLDTLIGCQFEATHQGLGEAVRARIMHAMVGCLERGAGTRLPDEVVWEVLQACMANLDQMVSRHEFCARHEFQGRPWWGSHGFAWQFLLRRRHGSSKR